MLKRMFLILLLLSASDTRADDNLSTYNMNLSFTPRFFKTAFEHKKGNFVVSPLSVYVATLLLINGADGTSRKELEEAFISADPKTAESDLEIINRKLSDYMTEKKDTIKIANTIIGDHFRQDYEDKVKKELFAQSVLQNLDGALILQNTVDFEDEWEDHFDAAHTTIEDFHSLDGTLDKVDMMHDSKRMVDYYQDSTMQAIRLPYKGGNTMHILLPKEGVDFNQFVQNLNLNFSYDMKKEVAISLPRFKIKYDNEDMISYYKKWGIFDVFDPHKANLSKISDIQHYVEKIIHNADITTTEKGTEAHAVTIIMLDGMLMMDSENEKIVFNANRPFIFMINNGDFIGAYVKGERFELKKKYF